MRQHRKRSLPVRLAFALSVAVHAVLAWLLLTPEAPSAPAGGPPGETVAIAVVFGGGGAGGTPGVRDAAESIPASGGPAGTKPEPVPDVPVAEPSSVAEAPVAEAPVAEAPVAEAPAVEAPAVEASVADVAAMPAMAAGREPAPEPRAEAKPSVEPVQPVERAPPAVATTAEPLRKPQPPERRPDSALPAEAVADTVPAGPDADPTADVPRAGPVAGPLQFAALHGPAKLAGAGVARDTPAGRTGSAGGATAGGVESRGAGGPPDDFLARLQAWLERHKRYPRRARLRNEEGIVLVRFTVGGDGAVSGIDIARSSGHALLDAEATNLLRRAEPLPSVRLAGIAVPLKLEVPIRFSLN